MEESRDGRCSCFSRTVAFHSQNRGGVRCTLCRSQRTAINTLCRARQREVNVENLAWWPKSGQARWSENDNPLDEPVILTRLDDAFASVGHVLATASRQCGRYLGSHPEVRRSSADGNELESHFKRYHYVTPPRTGDRNPLSSRPMDNVRVDVAPGTYAVTAGRWGQRGGQHHTHIVHLDPQQSVQLSFTV